MATAIETATVRRAQALFGGGLRGVAAFGSWARDELSTGSDIDMLIVLAERVPIRRDLYRRWDERPLAWHGHAVEPHFVHLPPLGRRCSGLWAEVATDARLLYEGTERPTLGDHLAAVRDLIARGRLCRRKAHGQPYWTLEAGQDAQR